MRPVAKKTLALFVFVASLSSAFGQTASANPRFAAPWGYGIIDPTPNPAVAGEVVFIDVTMGNDGLANASDVELKLSYNDWSIGFGGWTEISTQRVDIRAGTDLVVPFTHTFSSAVHTCLEAKITGVGEGGDANPNDNRAQINMEVVLCDREDCSYSIPIANNYDHPIVVGQIEVGCKPAADPEAPDTPADTTGGLRPGPCTFPVELEVPSLSTDNSIRIPPHSEVVVKVRANLTLGTVANDVFVQAVDVSDPSAQFPEHNHVLIRLVPTSVPELLNFPLCCIQDVRLRVRLERILAEALDAYSEGMYRKAVKLLRSLLNTIARGACGENLNEDAKSCLERLKLVVTDAMRIVADRRRTAAPPGDYPVVVTFQDKEGNEQPSVETTIEKVLVDTATEPPTLESPIKLPDGNVITLERTAAFTITGKDFFLYEEQAATADAFLRNAQYEAALLQYSRVLPPYIKGLGEKGDVVRALPPYIKARTVSSDMIVAGRVAPPSVTGLIPPASASNYEPTLDYRDIYPGGLCSGPGGGGGCGGDWQLVFDAPLGGYYEGTVATGGYEGTVATGGVWRGGGGTDEQVLQEQLGKGEELYPSQTQYQGLWRTHPIGQRLGISKGWESNWYGGGGRRRGESEGARMGDEESGKGVGH